MLWLLPFENYKMLLLALFLSLNSTSTFPGFFGFVVVFLSFHIMFHSETPQPDLPWA